MKTDELIALLATGAEPVPPRAAARRFAVALGCGLLDARRIGLMKPTAYLINTARGPIVDGAALVAALLDAKIAGAGLDVFDQEPLPPGHPFTRLSNVILTPHLGWPTDEAYERFADAAADALLAYLDGRDVPRFLAQH